MKTDKKIVQKIVLGGVIVKDGKILILQRHDNEDIYPGLWELPSGKRNFLESSDDALRREIKEETGLEVFIITPFFVFDYQIAKEEEIRDSTQINFIVQPETGGVVKLSSEHQSFVWINKDELEMYNLTKVIKQTIYKAFDMFPQLGL